MINFLILLTYNTYNPTGSVTKFFKNNFYSGVFIENGTKKGWCLCEIQIL